MLVMGSPNPTAWARIQTCLFTWLKRNLADGFGTMDTKLALAVAGGAAAGAALMYLAMSRKADTAASTAVTAVTTLAQAEGQLMKHVEGTWVSAMIYLGDRMGLYLSLKKDGPLSSTELAASTQLSERWLREWLCGQAAAGILSFDESSDRFSLNSAYAPALADPEGEHDNFHGFFAIFPGIFASLPDLPNCFHSGLGMTYDRHGPAIAESMERLHVSFAKYQLVQSVLPCLQDGKLIARLEHGAVVADVGCGGAVSLCEMARRFPNSSFHGYELSTQALERAARNIERYGVTNVTMHDCAKETLSGKPAGGRGTKRMPAGSAAVGPFDFVMCYDVLHDMAFPRKLMEDVREALKPSGSWFVVDIASSKSMAENIRNPAATICYSFSVALCMSSGLSEEGGEGLGPMSFHPELATRWFNEAGFSTVKVMDIPDVSEASALNVFFEVRP
jgi:2-polyprenyl-3-methyl-5-hydroxy-6-metoxy-1,4-benzoquinol methylase